LTVKFNESSQINGKIISQNLFSDKVIGIVKVRLAWTPGNARGGVRCIDE
jgi:hypothetical protein